MTLLNSLEARAVIGGLGGDVATELEYQIQNKPYALKNARELIIENASARLTMTTRTTRTTMWRIYFRS